MRNKSIVPSALLLIPVVVLCSWAGGARATTQTVVLDGDLVPGMGTTRFVRFDVAPSIDDTGAVAFTADLSVAQEGVFVWFESAIEAVAISGDVILGSADQAIGELCFFDHAPSINASDEIAFPAAFGVVGSGQCTDQAVVVSDATGLRVRAASGDGAPGTGGDRFCSFDHAASLNGPGGVAFQARTGDCDRGDLFPSGPTEPGIFLEAGAGPVAVALPGTTAPGTGGASFTSFDEAPSINDAGDVAFVAAADERGVFALQDDALVKIAYVGDSAPGDTTFTGFLDTGVAINATSEIVFNAAAGGVDGIFLHSSQGLSTVVRAGDPVPDEVGREFALFPSAPVINAAGEVAFVAAYGMPGAQELTSGLFLADGRSVRAVALPGQSAPGAGEQSYTEFVLSPSLNDARQLAYVVSLGPAASPGQGVFVVALPEPAALTLELTAFAVVVSMLGRRRSSR